MKKNQNDKLAAGLFLGLVAWAVIIFLGAVFGAILG